MSWREQAACLGADPDLFFPERGASTAKAHAICAGCPVRAECLEYAVEAGEPFGIWGGAAERTRRVKRKEHIEVGHKRCSRCRKVRPLAEFPSNIVAKDGLHSHCRSCRALHARSQRGAVGWAVQGRAPKGIM